MVTTQPLDPTKPVDPLAIYSAMIEQNGVHIVTNGNQTNDIMQIAASGQQFDIAEALEERTFEPDPSHTPRISAVYFDGEIQFSILREDPENPGQLQEPKSFPPIIGLTPGIGHEIQTYLGDGDTDSYRGGPIPMPLIGTSYDIAGKYWEALNKENRVALAVKAISVVSKRYELVIVNKYKFPNEEEFQKGPFRFMFLSG